MQDVVFHPSWTLANSVSNKMVYCSPTWPRDGGLPDLLNRGLLYLASISGMPRESERPNRFCKSCKQCSMRQKWRESEKRNNCLKFWVIGVTLVQFIVILNYMSMNFIHCIFNNYDVLSVLMLANLRLVVNFFSRVFLISVAAWNEKLVDPRLVHLTLVADAILLFTILQHHCQRVHLHPTSVGICGVESLYAEWLILCSFIQWNIVILCILSFF